MKYSGLTPVEKETQKVREAKLLVRRCLQLLKRKYGCFMYALTIFEPVAVKESMKPATDGKYLYFHPQEVLHSYKNYGIKELTRSIFHMLLHGIFGHFEIVEEEKWLPLRWAVMDLKVDRMLCLLGYSEETMPHAEFIYHSGLYLEGRRKKKRTLEIIQAGKAAWVDEHTYWARQKMEGITKEESDQQEEDGEEQRRKKIAAAWKQARSLMFPAQGGTAEDGTKEISMEGLLRRMEQKGYGTSPGIQEWLEHAAEGKSKNYQEILRQFLKEAEVVKEEDTIDPALYLYGLECYGDVALIEPLELSEQKRLDTLVLAVDTSGSCIHMVPVFLRETAGILTDTERMVQRGRVYYMECDTQVTEELFFENFQQAAQEMSSRTVRGGGGTDFTPVFEKIEEQIGQGTHIDGLFYLSDGDGVFPEKAPEYPVYFVMDRRIYEQYEPEIPDWVTVVWL